MSGKRERGDYQTPLHFAAQVCGFLKHRRGVSPSVILEPTCGTGNFLKSSLVFSAKKYYGIEINPEYCRYCADTIKDSRVEIINADFFTYELNNIVEEPLLVIGNPPWVTNSTLSSLGSSNVPQKTNFKGMRGVEAITGASNFDIGEYIILRLVKALRGRDATIAMLCKTTVARNVFKELKRENVGASFCEMIEFNAVKIFGVNASACLLLIRLSPRDVPLDVCKIYSFGDEARHLISTLDYRDGRFYDASSVDERESLDGRCSFEWRQGVKHDCSKVMELTYEGGRLRNGRKEIVDIEDNIVFPLVKSSMYKRPVINDFSKYVIVTQRRPREDTAHLQRLPKTWAYLNENAALFNGRKSSIYHGAPLFAMFGVGEYSYSPYKVGVSGFYRRPLFAVLSSPNGKPVMTDDTSYFISFDSYDMAYVAMLLLNSDTVQSFLQKIAFLDAKRPYTKKVLERIDIAKAYAATPFKDLKVCERSLGLMEDYLTPQMFDAFSLVPEMRQRGFALTV